MLGPECSALGFHWGYLYFASFSFPSTLTSPTVPSAEKTPVQHDATTTIFHRWHGTGQVMSGAWLPPAKQFLVSSDQKSLFLTVRESFRYSKRAFTSFTLLLGRGFRLALCHKAQISTVLQWCPSGGFSFLHTGSQELSQSNYQVLGHLSYQGPSPPNCCLTRKPALGRVLVVPNFFHLRIMEAIVLLGTFKQHNFFVAFLRSVPQHLSLSSAGSSTSGLGFCPDMHC